MSIVEIEYVCPGILNIFHLSLTSPHSTGERRRVEKGRECRKMIEDKIEEPHWRKGKRNMDHRLEKSPVRRTGREGFRAWTTSTPLSSRRLAAKRQSILVMDLAAQLLSCQALCSQEKGLPRNVGEGVGAGVSIQAFMTSTLSLLEVRLQLYHFAFCLCLLLSFVCLFIYF